VWCLGAPFQSKSQKAISYQQINKVASLGDDLALTLKSHSVRIVAPIPGKAVIGIELANATRQTVYLKEILASSSFDFLSARPRRD
jgi:hypothetical protein